MRSLFVATLLFICACNDPGVSSEADAELAYVGLDGMVERAMGLGFDGFNAADSANIPEQSGVGDIDGTIVVTGQVDQGASNNKGMRLFVTLADYADVIAKDDEDVEYEVAYATDETDLPALDLSLRSIPDGTLTGTLVGTFLMGGDLGGAVTLDLALTGEIEPDPNVTEGTRRVEGSTQITGTATAGSATFVVDVTR